MTVALIIAGSLTMFQAKPVDFSIASAPLGSATIQNENGVNDEGHSEVAAHQLPIAIGFGKDVPLSFAVRQVVPRQFRIEFDPAVDQANRVSWQGGRSWPHVLHDLVAPLGLHFNTRAGIVHIAR